MLRWRAAFVSVLVGLTACAERKVYVAEHYARPARVAVLPMINETNDLDGPAHVRKALFNYLSQRGYTLVPLAEIDAKLNEQGFTNGGQLGAATPQQIGQWVGADGLFYSALEDFNYILLGYYTQRTVKIRAHMVDAKTGDKLWEADRGWASRAVVADTKKAQQQLAVQAAAKFVEKMTHIPLQFETTQAVLKLLSTLPQ